MIKHISFLDKREKTKLKNRKTEKEKEREKREKKMTFLINYIPKNAFVKIAKPFSLRVFDAKQHVRPRLNPPPIFVKYLDETILKDNIDFYIKMHVYEDMCFKNYTEECKIESKIKIYLSNKKESSVGTPLEKKKDGEATEEECLYVDEKIEMQVAKNMELQIQYSLQVTNDEGILNYDYEKIVMDPFNDNLNFDSRLKRLRNYCAKIH